jgi:hypothetical protein
VVKVSVRKNMRLNFMLILFQPSNIWRDVIDAWIITAREQKSHIYDDNLIIIFDGVHILTNSHFAHATNRNNPKFRLTTANRFWLHFGAKLLTAVSVINRLIYRNINQVL